MQTPCDPITLHNGMEYIQAQMKLNAITCQHHPEEEIERRLAQIDTDMRQVEDALRNDLAFRGLLHP